MSRGPGKIERAIAAAFREHPDTRFTVQLLCLRAYPGIFPIEKKHRVIVIAAARRVAQRLGWCERRKWGPGDPLEFVNISLRLEVEGNVYPDGTHQDGWLDLLDRDPD